MNNHLNNNLYYALELFLDPAETNPVLLCEFLKTKESEWKKKVNSDPKFELFCVRSKQWRENSSEAKESDLRRLLQEAKSERLKKLRAAIIEIERDGLLEQHEYDYLLKTFGGKGRFFTEETIKQELHLPLYVFTPPKEPEIPNGVKIPGESEMNKIEDDLKIVNSDQESSCSNLYDLLKLGRLTDTETLREEASKKNEEIRKKSNKTPQVNAKARLLGRALIYFKTDEARKGYDIALRRRPIDELKKERFALRTLGKSVTRDDYNLSIEEAMECGLSREEAEWHIYDYYCLKRKCPYPTGRNLSVSKVQCLNCFRLNDPEAAFCSCGAPLKIECPQCGQRVETGRRFCPQCGFAVCNMPNALLQIENARQKLASGHFSEAEESLRQAEIWWPGNSEIKTLRQTLSKRNEEEHQFKVKVTELEKKLKEAVQRRKLYQAQKMLSELRVLSPNSPILVCEEKKVEAVLSDVSRKLKNLSRTMNSTEITAICEDILSLTADCAEAQAALDRIPPSPATCLQAEATPNGICLQWNESPSRLKTGYNVVRKQNASPSSIKDGKLLIADLKNTNFIDSTCQPGVIYGYTVFTKRDLLTENIGCHSKLVQIVQDVEKIRLLPGNGSITFGWQPIDAATGMTISRWKGDSIQEVAEKTIRLSKVQGYVDFGLENGSSYIYRLQTHYRAPDGSEVLSQGVVVNGTPCMPPTPVNDLKISTTETSNRLTFQWTPPKRGMFYLFNPLKSPESLDGKAETISLLELEKRFGNAIPITDPASGLTTWMNSTMGVCHFLPVSYDNGVVVYGKPKAISRVDDVFDIQIQINDTNFFLTWKWPKGINDVWIQIRRDAVPQGPNDPKGQKVLLTRNEYDFHRAFQCSDQYKNCHFVIYSFIPDGSIFSKGVTFFTGKTSIRYDLRIETSLFSKKMEAKLLIQRESDNNGGLPEFVVKKEIGRPPLNRNFGENIMTIPATTQAKQSVVLKNISFNESAFIQIFVANQTKESFYSINSPPPDELELVYRRGHFFQRLKHFFFSLFRSR